MRNYGSGYKPQESRTGAPYELFQRFPAGSLSGQFDHPATTSTPLPAHTQTSGQCTVRFRAHLPTMAHRSETESNGSQALCNPRRIRPLAWLGKLGNAQWASVPTGLREGPDRSFRLLRLSLSEATGHDLPAQGPGSGNSITGAPAVKTSSSCAESVDGFVNKSYHCDITRQFIAPLIKVI